LCRQYKLHAVYAYLEGSLYKRDIPEDRIGTGTINATMEYVRDELRPQMFHILPKDEFIREAMSTSFVNKGVMEDLVEDSRAIYTEGSHKPYESE